MDSKQYATAKELFFEIIDLKYNKAEEYLRAKCNDQLIIDEVISLLKTHSSAKQDTKHIAEEVSQTVLQSTLFFPNERYALIKQIGHGGMGSVYLAQRKSENIKQKVAIKVLQIIDERSHQRFTQETQILSQLSHPNISQFIDAGFLLCGRPYVAMEYIEGETITQHCSTLGLNKKIELFLQLCLAVKHAHRNLIIHQDIKPDNVLVNDNNQVKLLDFGISKIVDDSLKQTQTILRAMTPGYASPEQLLGKPISVSSDIYSLGIVLYELLSGKLPFNLEGLSPIELEKLLSANPNLKPSKQLSLSAVNKKTYKVDDDLDNITLKALDFDTNERYQSVDELIDDLILYQNNKPIKAGKKGTAYIVKKFFIRNKLTMLALFVLLIFALTFVLTLIDKNSAIENQLGTISKQRDDLLLEQIRAENIASTFTYDRYADFDNNGKQETVVNHSINIGNGNLFYSEEIDLPSSPIKFAVYYNSKSAIQTRGGLPTNLIGKGWTHSFSRKLFVGNDNMTRASAHKPDGSVVTFIRENGLWENEKGSKEELMKQDRRWIFINELGENEIYDSWGKLLEIQTKKHKMKFEWDQFTIGYSSWDLTSGKYKNRLSKISTNDGHFIEFNYKHDSTTVIESITDEIGRTWELGYDLFYNLAVIKNPNGTGKKFYYNEPSLPNAITTISDTLYDGYEIRYINFDYDGHTRVRKVSYKSNMCENEILDIDYCCETRTVTNSKGKTNQYTVKSNGHKWELIKFDETYKYPICEPNLKAQWQEQLLKLKKTILKQ